MNHRLVEQLLQSLPSETKPGGYRLPDFIHAIVQDKKFRIK